MAQILIVEDEEVLNHLIKINMELMGHHCVAVFDGESVFTELAKQDFDLILLDVMLPIVDGFHVIQKLREGISVIFLTARQTVQDRVKGLNLGADDYLTKPFSMLELQARVESVLRRAKKANLSFQLGNVKVDLATRQIFYKDELMDFPPQELLLIEALIKNRNIVLSREKLLEIAWGHDYEGVDRTVDVHISQIRKKLGWEKNIKTVYKLGYRLEVPR